MGHHRASSRRHCHPSWKHSLPVQRTLGTPFQTRMNCPRSYIEILVYVQNSARETILAGLTQTSSVRPNAPLGEGLALKHWDPETASDEVSCSSPGQHIGGFGSRIRSLSSDHKPFWLLMLVSGDLLECLSLARFRSNCIVSIHRGHTGVTHRR